jgi:hypothetical protein
MQTSSLIWASAYVTAVLCRPVRRLIAHRLAFTGSMDPRIYSKVIVVRRSSFFCNVSLRLIGGISVRVLVRPRSVGLADLGSRLLRHQSKVDSLILKQGRRGTFD